MTGQSMGEAAVEGTRWRTVIRNTMEQRLVGQDVVAGHGPSGLAEFQRQDRERHEDQDAEDRLADRLHERVLTDRQKFTHEVFLFFCEQLCLDTPCILESLSQASEILV